MTQPCPSCGVITLTNTRFCHHCGAEISLGIIEARTQTYHPVEYTHTLPIGTQLGKYRIERVIDTQGLCISYFATDTALNRPCFMRQLAIRPEWDTEAQLQAQRLFQREIDALVKINSPGQRNIPEIFDILPEHNCLTMKYIDGLTLDNLLHERGGRLPEAEALSYVLEICRALVYLHSKTSRSLMPHNLNLTQVLRDTSGRIWLLGFRLEREPLFQMPGAEYLHYVAPEQLLGQSEPRSDVYALGTIFHTLLTGYRPVPGQLLPPAEELNPDISAPVIALIAQATKSDPSARPTSADLLLEFNRVLDPASGPTAIEAPDGNQLDNRATLITWCETHWEQAAAWLYGTLPDQIERFWLNEAFARDVRHVTLTEKDRNAGLDTLLVQIDPDGYGAQERQVIVDPVAIDCGRLAINEPDERIIVISNSGKRYVHAHIIAPKWIEVDPAHVSLIPVAQESVVLRISAAGHKSGSRLADTLSVHLIGAHVDDLPLASVSVRATVVRRRIHVPQYLRSKRVILALILLALAIWIILPLSLAGDKTISSMISFLVIAIAVLATEIVLHVKGIAQAKSKGTGPFRAMFLERQPDASIKAQMYHEALNAIELRQWDRAAGQIYRLEQAHANYRNIMAIVTAQPELLAAFRREINQQDSPANMKIE